MILGDLNLTRINANKNDFHWRQLRGQAPQLLQIRLGTREKSMRSKHNPSADLMQPRVEQASARGFWSLQ
jgi:hypothetical protein